VIALAASAGACRDASVFFHCAGNIISAAATSSSWAQRTVSEGQAAGNPLAVGVHPAQLASHAAHVEAPQYANFTQEELLLDLLNFFGNSSNVTVSGLGHHMADRFDLPVATTEQALHQYFEQSAPVNWTSASPHDNTTTSRDNPAETEDEAIEATLEKLKALLPHNSSEDIVLTDADLHEAEEHFKQLFEQLHRLSAHNSSAGHSEVGAQGDTSDPSLFSAGGVTARYVAELYGALVATQAVGVAHGVIDGFGNTVKSLICMKNVPKDAEFFRSQQILLSAGWGAQAGVRKGFSAADGADAISTYLKAFETSPRGQVALTFLVGLIVQALPYLYHGCVKKPIKLEPTPSLWQVLKVPQMVWERCFAALESELHTGPVPVPKALLQAALNVALDEMKAHGVDEVPIAVVGALFTFLIHADRIYQFIKYKKIAEGKNIEGVMPKDAERMALTSLQTFLFSSMSLHALVGMGASPPDAEHAALESPATQFLVGGIVVGGFGSRVLAPVFKGIVHYLIKKVPIDKLPANFHRDKLDATIDMIVAAQAGVGAQYLAGPYAGLLARLLASVPAKELVAHMRDCVEEMSKSPVVGPQPTPLRHRDSIGDVDERSPLAGDARRSSQVELAPLPKIADADREVIVRIEPHLRSPQAADGPVI
jgi:hypothetical protein